MKAWKLAVGGGLFVFAAYGVYGHTDLLTPESNDNTAMRMGAMGSEMMPGMNMMGSGMGMMGSEMTPGMNMMGSGMGMMGPGMCMMRGGWGMMRSAGNGMMGSGTGMMSVPQLFTYRDRIRRTVTETKNGVETLTESDVPRVARLIQSHVEGMAQLLDAGMPVRMWDPLFADLYAHYDEIEIVATETEKGVRVVETGTTPEAIKLVRAHAEVVSRFLKNGWREMRIAHPSPLTED